MKHSTMKIWAVLGAFLTLVYILFAINMGGVIAFYMTVAPIILAICIMTSVVVYLVLLEIFDPDL